MRNDNLKCQRIYDFANQSASKYEDQTDEVIVFQSRLDSSGFHPPSQRWDTEERTDSVRCTTDAFKNDNDLVMVNSSHSPFYSTANKLRIEGSNAFREVFIQEGVTDDASTY